MRDTCVGEAVHTTILHPGHCVANSHRSRHGSNHKAVNNRSCLNKIMKLSIHLQILSNTQAKFEVNQKQYLLDWRGHDLLIDNCNTVVFTPVFAAAIVVDCMVDLFGVPPDHLLCAGMYSKVYFVQDPAGHWRLKTRAEFWDNNILSYGRKLYHYHSLDEVEHLDLVDMREVEVEEKKMCIDLLKGMLQLDANVRISPNEVLAHPFITWSDQQYTSCYGTNESSTRQADEEGKVRSAPPKSCLRWYEDVRHLRETWRQRQLSLPLLPCKMYQEDTATTSDDKEPQQNKKKKGFKRFCSLMRRMFCCCIRVEGNEG
ncbi:homeodomain-interacting protein kinase 1-like [Scomber scombrus]|uniref:Homeodomain-interacting protein kinase 1-like n=1 Tax=Scomber scombrus TaxID=13677 RepID=A0AAV1NL77_SCOSC